MGDKLFKRGPVWYAWVPRLGGGTRAVSTGCTDRKAAGTVRARLEREAVDPDHAAKSSARTIDLLDDHIRALIRRGRAEGTVSYAKTKAGHLRRLLPEHAVDVTHHVLEGYVDRRLSEGASRSTTAKELGVLRSVLKLARKNGFFEADPATVLPAVGESYVPRTRVLAYWEAVAFLSNLPPARAAHAATIIALALRWGESVRLTRRHVAIAGEAHVPGSKTKASNRVVPVVGVFRTMLAWALERAPGVEMDAPLFDRWANSRRDIHGACKAAGIAPLSPNDLRRTHATWLRRAGVEPHLIGVQLGHTTSAMVERVYGRLNPESLGALLEGRIGAAGVDGALALSDP